MQKVHDTDPQLSVNRLATYWSTYWCRAANVQEEHWDELLTHLPPRPSLPVEAFPPITREDIRKHAKGLKTSAATGLDGVTRDDLIHAPDSFLDGLCSLYNVTEQTGAWPYQVVHSKIVSLAKLHNALTPQQARPIQIFSVVYRTWSSLRARQVQAALRPLLSRGGGGGTRQRDRHGHLPDTSHDRRGPCATSAPVGPSHGHHQGV